MISYKDGQILIENKPVLLIAGEIHYYRLDPSEWQDRINRLKECGMNVVSTYVPWVCHEYTEGNIDIEGKTNPRLNLKGFIELCEENGLYIFLRPGPFIMAEMKNDGIPYWVYKNYPGAIPKGFDGAPPTTPTLDYLSEGFLHASKNWYASVMSLAAKHSYPNGGKIIAVQLDNEIGMLSWVSNKPDLTENVLNYFIDWLNEKYDSHALNNRYPFEIAKNKEAYSKFISPMPPYDVNFHLDLGYFMRSRFKRYIKVLKGYSEEFGVKDILFVVNIHGTGGGRGFTYPVGVSQLLETYDSEDNVISGSDVYFSDMKIQTLQDMYLCNGITECVNKFGKPLTSVEFNIGDCNFGDDLNVRAAASSNDAKIRLFIAQGNKLINLYLFSGGQNYRFPDDFKDGNNRCATTGENHGFAAPIGPEGIPNYTYPRTARVLNQFMNLQEKFATGFIEYDDVAYGFIPDYFMTEYAYEKSEKIKEIYANLSKNRAYNSWESTVRALLLHGVKLRTVDIQNCSIGEKANHLILPSASYMSKSIQQKILDFITNGGSVLLHGQIPLFDMEGNPCTILADAFETSGFQYGSGYRFGYNASICGDGFLKGMREYHSDSYESMDVKNAQPILKIYDTGKTCAFYKTIGQGKVVAITCNFKCFLQQYKTIFDNLGIKQTLTHDITVPGYGVFMTMTKNSSGDRFLYLINIDDIDKDFNVYCGGQQIIPSRKIHLPSNDSLTLPVSVDFGFAAVNYSTIEIVDVKENVLFFRNTEKYSEISVTTSKQIISESFMKITQDGEIYTINTDNRLLGDVIKISFE